MAKALSSIHKDVNERSTFVVILIIYINKSLSSPTRLAFGAVTHAVSCYTIQPK